MTSEQAMAPARPEFITIGRVLGPWGNKGRLKIEVATEFPQRFAPSSKVYIGRQPVTIDSSRRHKRMAIVKLNRVDGTAEAEALRGQLVEIHHSQLYALPEGQYYHFQLIGLEVRTTQGELLGKITDILTAPSNDNYVVTGDTGEILVPAIEDVVKSIDLDQGYLLIEPIEGLLSLNKKAAS